MLLVFFYFNNYYFVLFDQKVTDFFRACIMYQHYCCREHCRLTALMPESCSEKKVTMMVISCQQMLLSRNSSITERLWMFWRATFSSSISSTSTLWSLLPQSLVKAKWPWCDQKKKWLGGCTRRQNRCARQNPWSHNVRWHLFRRLLGRLGWAAGIWATRARRGGWRAETAQWNRWSRAARAIYPLCQVTHCEENGYEIASECQHVIVQSMFPNEAFPGIIRLHTHVGGLCYGLVKAIAVHVRQCYHSLEFLTIVHFDLV